MITVAPRGDLFLLVGSSQEPIRVHSIILQNASARFAALVDPLFEESNLTVLGGGQTFMQISLPEDDHDGMKTLCRILHSVCRSGEVFSPAQLFDLAILADKYGVAGPTSLATTIWIKQAAIYADHHQLWKLLLATHLIGDAETFQTISRQLIMEYGGSFSALVHDTIMEYTSFELGLMLEEARTKVRNMLWAKILHHQQTSGFENPPDCNVAMVDGMIDRNLGHLADLVQYHEYSLDQILKDAQDVKDSHYKCATTGSKEAYHEPVHIDEMIRMGMEEVQECLKGLCWRCYTAAGKAFLSEHECVAN